MSEEESRKRPHEDTQAVSESAVADTTETTQSSGAEPQPELPDQEMEDANGLEEPAVKSEENVKIEEVNSAPLDAEKTVTTAPTTSQPNEPNGTETPMANGNKRFKQDTLVVVPHKTPQLFYTLLKTGLVYDVRMRYHAKIFTSYFEYIDPHPEDPRRIYRIYKKLAEAGLIQDTSLSGTDDIGPLMVKIPIREARAEEILEVHSAEHLKYISLTEEMTRDQLLEETEKGDSIYVNNDSYLLAKLSCGGSIEACKAVVEGKVKNSMAIVRPPGHHAEPDTPGGFCLFSNVAVAAKNILKSYPESVRRILILDWDIHHGNGTQKAFYNDPRVLYLSLHRYENGKFYPGTKFGGADMVGEGEGEGFSVNIPWSVPGVGDGDYVYAFRRVVMPIISEFDPDLVIVSAGFDAADGDLIGQCHVSPAGYGHMTHMLKEVARGKLAVILEGGYSLDAISESALGVAKVLIGEPPEATITEQPRLETLEVISEVVRIQSKYWKCMKPGNAAHIFEDAYDVNLDGLVSFAEPLRAHQAQQLFLNHSFISLPIIDHPEYKLSTFSTYLPSHMEDIVLASPQIQTNSTIIISIHDPPEVWANINPINGHIESSTSVVLEHPLTKVISKVRSELSNDSSPDDVGYIDINIPSYTEAAVHSNAKDNGEKTSSPVKSSTYNPTIFAQELLLWVWNNYVTYFPELKKVVFVGYGDAYQSIVHLYAKRPSQEVKDLVKGTVVFVSRSNLKALVPVMDESMVDWFYQSSVIFTSYKNACWTSASGNSKNGDSEDVAKRPRKKYGRVLKASVDGLWDVIHEKFDEGVDFILDSIEEFDESESS